MADRQHLLDSLQMARFVAKGYLRFDELIPDELNRRALAEMQRGIDSPPPFAPLDECYPPPSAIGAVLRFPEVQGIVESLVGPGCCFDHHAVHIRQPNERWSQHLHGDSIIDTRTEQFDIQLLYFPHDVPREMGGTLFVPGSHFRRINEADVARYQNLRGQQAFVGKAGTLLALHHGLWHCGRRNDTDRTRYMFKIRLNPVVKQQRLWNTDDLDRQVERVRRQPLFTWMRSQEETLARIFGTPEPWFEQATGRLEVVNRIQMWRSLTGDASFDFDGWLTRLENAP